MNRAKKQKGFSLIEVMIAVGILAISITAVIGISVGAIKRSARTENLINATMLARAKMADIQITLDKEGKKGDFPDERSEDGKFEEPYEDFSWKMEIKKVELPAPITGEKGSVQEMVGRQLTKQISNTVRELKLTVVWKEKGEDQTLDIVTHIVKL